MKIAIAAAILTLLILTLGGCGKASSVSTSSFVLTGSVSPTHTIGFLTPLSHFASLMLFGTPLNAATGSGSPLTVNAYFYRLHASAKDDCSNSVVIQDYGTNGIEKDLTFDPVLFYAKPSDTKIKCIAIELDDTITFRPDKTGVASWPGICNDTTMDYSSDLYRSNDALAWTDLNGSVVSARGTQLVPVTDRIFLYASTAPARVINGVVKVQQSQVSVLPITLETPTSLVFYANFDQRVSGVGSICHLNSPLFGFR